MLGNDKFFQTLRGLRLANCPPATQNIELNLKNRQHAIDTANYGPLNPSEPNDDYWQAKADQFKTSVEEAKTALCANCGFFNQTKAVLECIAQGIGEGTVADPYDTIEAGDVGYCEAFDFKCAGARTCDAWLAGGPIEFEGEDPCEPGYTQYGMKDGDNGRPVPNCIPDEKE